MTRSRWMACSLLAVASAAMISTVARGQNDAPDPGFEIPEAPPRLEIDFRAGVWYPRLDGTVALGASSGNPDLSLKSRFDLNDPEIALNAELTLRFDDRWYVRATAFDFSTDTSSRFSGSATFGGLTLNDGDPFAASVDMTSISLAAGVDLFRPFPDRRRREPAAASARVSATGGLRFLRVDQDVLRIAGGNASATGNWLALYGGIDIQLRWAADAARPRGRGFVLDGSLGVGVDAADGGLFVHVRGGLILEFTDNIGFEFGYRLLEVDFEDEPYGFDAGLQGLFLGGVVRF